MNVLFAVSVQHWIMHSLHSFSWTRQNSRVQEENKSPPVRSVKTFFSFLATKFSYTANLETVTQRKKQQKKKQQLCVHSTDCKDNRNSQELTFSIKNTHNRFKWAVKLVYNKKKWFCSYKLWQHRVSRHFHITPTDSHCGEMLFENQKVTVRKV